MRLVKAHILASISVVLNWGSPSNEVFILQHFSAVNFLDGSSFSSVWFVYVHIIFQGHNKKYPNIKSVTPLLTPLLHNFLNYLLHLISYQAYAITSYHHLTQPLTPPPKIHLTPPLTPPFKLPAPPHTPSLAPPLAQPYATPLKPFLPQTSYLFHVTSF
jgi:hypothetical protein